MNDPERLSTASDNEVERLLLGASRVRAPPGSKERAMLAVSGALGASGAAAGGAAAGKGTAVGIAKAGSFASLKWVGILGLTGIGTMAGAVVLHEVRESPPPTAVEMGPMSAPRTSPARGARSNASRTPETGGEWTPVPVDPLTLAPFASAEVVGAPSAPAPVLAVTIADAGAFAASTLPAELALLEQARSAVRGGDPARALSVLDRYAERFPQGSMMPEVTMIRIEALVKAGDRSAATRSAAAFLASDPESPYVARVQSLLGTSNQ
jgi:Outer membrane lipoprotein